ncbi:flagellar hook-associated protein FlgK [Sphingomonas sp. PvP018]|jgi:flagellar hook-associated protein 1 FlgK|uniref:flagellar hook-associated protein FlgK n=1 Tax=Sphingomonas sp. PvP018 TaxID=2817852 RepID=UPI001AE606AD|nr:flagellar hook-associated protein FlgK [Sphingomonas sp. PvP018]MBP2513665.1 flagellar hook-associated protein 1 FlgK [Sphingomonas sp. PvP018]
MSDLLSIGASGVRAYQTALNTVSENIANTGTAGYTRRTTNLGQVTSIGSGINASVATGSNGVTVTGISRSADTFRSLAVRNAGSDLARTETAAAWLGRIETSLTDNKLGDRLTSFFSAAQTLSADPTSVPARSVMLESATSAAAAFTATGKALDTAAADLDTATRQATQTLNSFGTALAKVNDGIARSQKGSTNAAQLGDQRDQLLEQMSTITDISTEFDDLGRATVRLGGASGPVFVAGPDAGNVSYLKNDEGAVGFVVQRTGTTSAVTPSGGALAGYAEGAQKIVAARDTLNGIATDFTTQVNAIQAQGRDLDGKAGTPLFKTGDTPTSITVALTDPRGIAAAGATGGARDASNLAALLATRDPTTGSEQRLTNMITSNAASLEQRKLVGDAQGAIRDGAVTARDSGSGVDLDSEAVDLLRFQQAYQASSRVIQTARDILQTILEIR